jgi:tRNA-splicing ligase RtcB
MAEPILIARHRDRPASLGFAPHGAGRNMVLGDLRPDRRSVLVGAGQFRQVGPAAEEPHVDAGGQRREPYGSIMAGDWEADAPWRRGKAVRTGDTPGDA